MTETGRSVQRTAVVGPTGFVNNSLPATIAIMRREFFGYFASPIAYAGAGVFLFMTGLAFSLGTFRPGGEASLRALAETWLLVILAVMLPLLCMRLLSEELRSGTIESLMTAPVTETAVVLGKFLGAVGFLLVLLAALLIYPAILAMYGQVDGTLLLCNYIGLILVGVLFIAVTLFFSACSRHQVVAGILSVVALAMMTFAFEGLAQTVEGWPRTLLQHLSVQSHFRDFVRGLLDVNHLAFFVTMTIAFLFVAVKVLEFRRWR